MRYHHTNELSNYKTLLVLPLCYTRKLLVLSIKEKEYTMGTSLLSLGYDKYAVWKKMWCTMFNLN